MKEKQMKLVRLLNPEMCLDCRFSEIQRVEMEQGKTRRIIRCRRLDCDNWSTTEDLAEADRFDDDLVR